MKKSKIFNIIFILIFLVGLSVMLYPVVSDWWNSFHQSRAVSTYVEKIEETDDTEIQQMLEDARDYNRKLASLSSQFGLYKEIEGYEETLNIVGTGFMGYVEIPKIGVELPIYHGTEASTLQKACGHLYGTSLPVGGVNTHSVISAHRGLPSAKLFTNLDDLVVGDTFMLHILGEVLTYKVEEINIVLPSDNTNLKIVEGKDYVTLQTCTPYGINSHRLLVRSVRIDTVEEKEAVYVQADAYQIDPIIVTPIVAIPMLLVLLIVLLFGGKKRKKPISIDDGKEDELNEKDS